MNITAQKTLAAAKKRMARNVLFWLFVFASTVTPSHGFIYWIYAAVLTILLVTPVYVNNLFLAPKFIAGKKYSTYLFILLPLTYVFALGYTLVLKVMLHNGLDPAYSNIVKAYNSGTTPDLSLASAIRESMPAYYGTFLVAISIFNMVWYAGIADRRQQLLEQAKARQVEAELNFLKNQINPHFLFNTLNNLYGLILIKSDEAKEVVPQLSAILRYLLYDSSVKAISFQKEKEIMEAYISLELLRLKDIDNIHCAISADKDYDIPPLLWVPVLENVFKHCTLVENERLFIDYKFIIVNNTVTIAAKNSFHRSDEISKPGIGIEHFTKRLALLYPGKHTLRMQECDSIFSIEIIVNL